MNFPYGTGLVTLTPPTGILTGGLSTIIALILALIQLALIIAILTAFVFIVLGGIKWITSGGDKQGLANAQGTITYAIIGLVLTFLSFMLLRLISGFFQIDLGAGIPREPTPAQKINPFRNPNYVP